MMKYKIKTCSGYYVDEPHRILSNARVALEAWDEVQDAENDTIFFYMDGEPLTVGSVIAEDFVVTEIEED